jgi:3-oxoadipate enol-lactonase
VILRYTGFRNRGRNMSNQKIKLRNGIVFNTLTEGPNGAAGNEPWIVCSNSLATNLHMWDDFAAAMRGRYRVFRYDQRGHGGTDAPPPPYAPHELVDDVVGLMDAAGIAKAHFVGLSMGGSTGLGLTLTFPDRVVSLTMCDCRTAAMASAWWDERIASARANGMAAMAEPTANSWFTKESHDAKIPAIDQLREMVRTTKLDGYVGCIEALKIYDYSKDLEGIRTPTLLVVGDQDADRPKTMAADAKRIPGAGFVIIPGAGHISNIENPTAFNAAVAPFIDKVQGGALTRPSQRARTILPAPS